MDPSERDCGCPDAFVGGASRRGRGFYNSGFVVDDVQVMHRRVWGTCPGVGCRWDGGGAGLLSCGRRRFLWGVVVVCECEVTFRDCSAVIAFSLHGDHGLQLLRLLVRLLPGGRELFGIAGYGQALKERVPFIAVRW